MGININDLDGSLNPGDTSLVSNDKTMIDNLRQLLDEELKISGGEMEDISVLRSKNGGLTVFGGYGLDVYLPDGNDDVTVYGDGINVYRGINRGKKGLYARKIREIERIFSNLEAFANQLR